MDWKSFHQHPMVSVVSYVLIVIFVVLGTKAYVGYLTIQQAIYNNLKARVQLEERVAYLKYYRLPYLESDYADYFTAHENGMPHEYEQVIKIMKKQDIAIPEQPTYRGEVLQLPNFSGGRQGYIQYKLKKVKH